MANKTKNTDKIPGNTEIATGKHNFATVSEALQGAMQKLWDAGESEKAAIAKHVQPFRDDKKKIKAEMKASTEGMEIRDFNLWYKIFERQQEAKLNMEEEDRKRVLTNIAVVFDAVTGQGCMIDCVTELKEELTGDQNAKTDAKGPESQPDETVAGEEEL